MSCVSWLEAELMGRGRREGGEEGGRGGRERREGEEKKREGR